MFTFLKTWFASSSKQTAKQPAKRKAPLTGRLRLEHLEDRLSPSTLSLGLPVAAPPIHVGHEVPALVSMH